MITQPYHTYHSRVTPEDLALLVSVAAEKYGRGELSEQHVDELAEGLRAAASAELKGILEEVESGSIREVQRG